MNNKDVLHSRVEQKRAKVERSRSNWFDTATMPNINDADNNEDENGLHCPSCSEPIEKFMLYLTYEAVQYGWRFGYLDGGIGEFEHEDSDREDLSDVDNIACEHCGHHFGGDLYDYLYSLIRDEL